MDNFIPINEVVTSSRELELDFHDQQYLAQRLRRTSSELADIPSLSPDQTDIILDHIPTRNMRGMLGPGNEMGVFLTETKDGHRGATITVSEADRPTFKFQLAPAMNMWEEWRPRQTKPTHYLENSSLLGLLATRVKEGEFLESALDDPAFDALELTRLLATHLKSSARRQEEVVRYSTTSPLETDEYESSTEISFSTKETRSRQTHRLAVGSLYEVGKAQVLKQYSYTTSASTRTGARQSGAGYVSASSKDGIPKNRLAYFTDIDQERNDPIDTLHSALLTLRRAYDLYDERRAA